MSFSLFGLGRKRYKHVFFDLDRTLWDFEQNMVETLRDIFREHSLDRAIPSFDSFLETFTTHNERMWEEYRRGNLRKEILRFKRFELTLAEYGVKDITLAKIIGDQYIEMSPLKTVLMPYTKELLAYLHGKYNLYIITNGFNEVQMVKLMRSGIADFFQRVVTSEMAGHHKPKAEAFGYSLSQANARKSESIMIGDDLEIDILGARDFGMDQIYYNPKALPHSEKITYEVKSLLDIKEIL